MPTISQRARARAAALRTPRGGVQETFDFMGSPEGSDTALWRGDDGRLYVVHRLTGEILSEVDETEPPF